MNLYVGNLNYAVKEQELQELFEALGEVSTTKIITDRETGRSKGFGFVEMPNDEEAKQAISNLNGKNLRDREISVTEARPKTEGNNRSFGNRN